MAVFADPLEDHVPEVNGQAARDAETDTPCSMKVGGNSPEEGYFSPRKEKGVHGECPAL